MIAQPFSHLSIVCLTWFWVFGVIVLTFKLSLKCLQVGFYNFVVQTGSELLCRKHQTIFEVQVPIRSFLLSRRPLSNEPPPTHTHTHHNSFSVAAAPQQMVDFTQPKCINEIRNTTPFSSTGLLSILLLAFYTFLGSILRATLKQNIKNRVHV